MNTFRSQAGRQDGAIRFLLSILLFLSLALPGRGEVLLSLHRTARWGSL